MSLSDLASLGSFVSGFAVLVSLVYLALQVRQAEKNQRGLMHQVVVGRAMDLNLSLARDPVLTPLLLKVNSPSTEPTADELFRYVSLVRAFFLNGEDVFHQFKHRLMHEDAYRSWERAAKYTLRLPSFRAAWKQTRANFGQDYVEHIEKLIAETLAAGGSYGEQGAKEWKADISAEAARQVSPSTKISNQVRSER